MEINTSKHEFKYSRPFKCGLALAKDENYVYKFIDINGQIIFDVKEKIESQLKGETILGFENIEDFVDGFSIIEYLNNEYLSCSIVIDQEGQIIIPPHIFSKIEYGDGLFLCTGKNHFHYYLNQKGEQAIQEKFQIAMPFNNGVAQIGNFYNRYLIDKNGNKLQAIDRDYEEAHEKTMHLTQKKQSNCPK